MWLLHIALFILHEYICNVTEPLQYITEVQGYVCHLFYIGLQVRTYLLTRKGVIMHKQYNLEE